MSEPNVLLDIGPALHEVTEALRFRYPSLPREGAADVTKFVVIEFLRRWETHVRNHGGADA